MNIMQGRETQPIDIQEMVGARLDKTDLTYAQKHNAIAALKYAQRIGLKKGENVGKEADKVANYLHRALTGKWIEHSKECAKVTKSKETAELVDKYKGEQVLGFPCSLIWDENWIFQGSHNGPKPYLDLIFNSGLCEFRDRAEAESDHSFKQLIPYVVFRCGNKVFSYRRGKGSGEKRLLGNRSIGVGGHINPVDQIKDNPIPRASFFQGVEREIFEEVHFEGRLHYDPIAVLNDDSDDVGKVHFGVVLLVTVSKVSHVVAKENSLACSGFIPIADLKGAFRSELESWSSLAIDSL